MFDTVRFDQRLARLIRYINLLSRFFLERKLDLSAVYKKDWNPSSPISSIQIISTILNYIDAENWERGGYKRFFRVINIVISPVIMCIHSAYSSALDKNISLRLCSKYAVSYNFMYHPKILREIYKSLLKTCRHKCLMYTGYLNLKRCTFT